MKPLQRMWIAFAILQFACAPALADPALWVAKSATATVYLFGTVHVLPADAEWHYPALDEALAASDSLYVETDDESRAKLKRLILKYGVNHASSGGSESSVDEAEIYLHGSMYVSNAQGLAKELDPSDRAKLQTAADSADLPGGVTTLGSMKPWLAALTLTNMASRKSGYEPGFGADTSLEREFKAHRKPVHSFETVHDQIEFFADTPPSLQLDLLRSVLDDHTKGRSQIAALVRDWLSGDVAAIAHALNAGILADYPELYDVLLVKRNRNFAGKIADLLKQHGTFFVAVGAGHLAGQDSVQVQLAKLGIATERVH